MKVQFLKLEVNINLAVGCLPANYINCAPGYLQYAEFRKTIDIKLV